MFEIIIIFLFLAHFVQIYFPLRLIVDKLEQLQEIQIMLIKATVGLRKTAISATILHTYLPNSESASNYLDSKTIK